MGESTMKTIASELTVLKDADLDHVTGGLGDNIIVGGTNIVPNNNNNSQPNNNSQTNFAALVSNFAD